MFFSTALANGLLYILKVSGRIRTACSLSLRFESRFLWSLLKRSPPSLSPLPSVLKQLFRPMPTLNIPFQQGGRSGRWGRVARKRRVWRISGNHRQCFCGSETLQPGCLKCRSCDTDSSTSQPKPCWSWNAARVAGNSRQMCPNTGEGGLHTA